MDGRGFVVPDAVEPALAWRYWRISPAGLLTSLTGSHQEWLPRTPAVAKCEFGRHDRLEMRFQLVSGFTRRPHTAPFEQCTCGLYAARSLRHLRGQMLFGLGVSVVGQVSLWGKVIPAKRGFRAEKAYPKRLYVFRAAAHRRPEILRLLERYRTPVEVIDGSQASFSPAAAVRSTFG